MHDITVLPKTRDMGSSFLKFLYIGTEIITFSFEKYLKGKKKWEAPSPKKAHLRNKMFSPFHPSNSIP